MSKHNNKDMSEDNGSAKYYLSLFSNKLISELSPKKCHFICEFCKHFVNKYCVKSILN